MKTNVDIGYYLVHPSAKVIASAKRSQSHKIPERDRFSEHDILHRKFLPRAHVSVSFFIAENTSRAGGETVQYDVECVSLNRFMERSKVVVTLIVK